MPTTIPVAPPILSFADDVLYFEIESDLLSGSAPPYTPDEPNLSIYIQVYQRRFIDSADVFIGEFTAPISRKNKRAFFDLSSILQLSPNVPNESHIGQLNGSGFDKSSYAKYYIKHGHQFGTPALPESTLTQSSDYYAISGSTRYLQGLPQDQEVIMLHSYVTPSGAIIEKQVLASDYDLTYFYNNTASSKSLTIKALFGRFGAGGLTQSYTVTQTPTLLSRRVSYIPTGWDQLSLGNELIGDQYDLDYYHLEFYDGATLIGRRHYQLDHRLPDHRRYIAYSNGCGGVEIARFSGASTKQTETTKEVFLRPRSINSDYQEGAVGTLIKGGHDVYTLRSGYYPLDYINHIRQMISARAWIIDTDRDQLYSIAILDDSIEVYDESEELYSLDIRYRQDTVPSFNTFNQ